MNNLGALEPESQPHPPPHVEVPIFKSGCDALDETRLDAELNAEIEKGSSKISMDEFGNVTGHLTQRELETIMALEVKE